MGGYGSGDWVRKDSKETTEAQRRVDIRYIKNQGMLKPGTAGYLSYTRYGRQSGSINFRTGADQIILDYLYRYQGGEWERVEEVVQFNRTACNYGGQRIWLTCPECGRRVVLLYGAGKRFQCRHCHNLTYATQQERLKDRSIRKAREIRQRLGGDGNLFQPMPGRPKGMHLETYRRLCLESSRASLISMAMSLDYVLGAKHRACYRGGQKEVRPQWKNAKKKAYPIRG
jgi:hypothetical protein